MKIRLIQLKVRTKQSTEIVEFSPAVTFIHGPVGTGKSTVARLIDYCFGGELERTPAIQREFVAAELTVELGPFLAYFERASDDTSSVRVTWSNTTTDIGSVNAPLSAGSTPILDDDVFNLSDLIFKLCDIKPIKVRKSKLDPDSPLVRLSIRDLLWYCYLEQHHLDSSFFRMEDPYKRLKSRDAMRFITGLHSDRMNELDIDLTKAVDEQRSKREAVKQLRSFMTRFQMGTETELLEQIGEVEEQLQNAIARRSEIDRTQASKTHTVEPLRQTLRELSQKIETIKQAISDAQTEIEQQEALRSELVTAKIKSNRAEQAGKLLQGAEFQRCPQCGSDITGRDQAPVNCFLCGSLTRSEKDTPALELDALRRDLNERIDELAESLARRKREIDRQKRSLASLLENKRILDQHLTEELARYDSAYTASVRGAEREVATCQERLASLNRLREVPKAIQDLEREAGELQGRIDSLRSSLAYERVRLQQSDEYIEQISNRFKEILLKVHFPGVYEGDRVKLDPRNWLPYIEHSDLVWGFYDAGSGGKKTLFNVCYALAVHTIAVEHDLPLPRFLIIDSPTKNISEDENPELVRSLYRQIYALASKEGHRLQFVLIDSDLVVPEETLPKFSERRMAGEADAPCLISYYDGP